MEIGIVGLPLSGKTTIFNALTRTNGQSISQAAQSNIGVVKVPDPRLNVLTKIFNPKKTIHAEVKYFDIAGVPGSQSLVIDNDYLANLQRATALLLVIRAFEDPSVPLIETTVDPFRDLSTMELELIFSDMAFLEKRLGRLQAGLKGAKHQEKEAIKKEREVLDKIRLGLENEIPIRDQVIPEQDKAILSSYQFLTSKPQLVAINIGEESLGDTKTIENSLKARSKSSKGLGITICGKLEAELAQINEDEELEFRQSIGAGESSMNRMLELSYNALGMVSFFTVGEDEVRAWSILNNTTALKASGKIHSDIERGFIRAQIVHYKDLVEAGSIAEARKKGTLRTEGKSYLMKDGDIVEFLFNI